MRLTYDKEYVTGKFVKDRQCQHICGSDCAIQERVALSLNSVSWKVYVTGRAGTVDSLSATVLS